MRWCRFKSCSSEESYRQRKYFARMVKLADLPAALPTVGGQAGTLASGASGREVVQVQVLFFGGKLQQRKYFARMVKLADLPAGPRLVEQAGTLASGDVVRCSVYCLSSQTRKYLYVGMTNNVERRVREHNSGKERTTRAYRPFRLVYVEAFESRSEARIREKYLKSGRGKALLRKLEDNTTR